MVKVFVPKENYDSVRKIEKETGMKIHKHKQAMNVVDCVKGQWGIWTVKRCYRGGLKYIADVELVRAASNEIEAILWFNQMIDKAKQSDWKVKYMEL